MASSEDKKIQLHSRTDRSKLDPKADFLYMVTNNTIYGTKWPEIPEPLPGCLLAADASSNVLSQEMDVEKFGLISSVRRKTLTFRPYRRRRAGDPHWLCGSPGTGIPGL